MNNSFDNIDHVFQSAQTQKKVQLSPGAWNRMDELLDHKEAQSHRSWRVTLMGIAASLTLLIAAAVAFNPVGESYHLEMLAIDESEWLYSTSEVAQLNEEHQVQNLQKLRPFYNQKGELKATVN